MKSVLKGTYFESVYAVKKKIAEMLKELTETPLHTSVCRIIEIMLKEINIRTNSDTYK